MANNLKKERQGYGYTYTDLAQVNNYIEANGWDYYQTTETIEGEDYIITWCNFGDGNYQARRGCKVPKATLSGKSNPAQELGSALTYARRYSLFMAYGLATTDDDAACLTITPAEKKFNEKQDKLIDSKIKLLVNKGKDENAIRNELSKYNDYEEKLNQLDIWLSKVEKGGAPVEYKRS